MNKMGNFEPFSNVLGGGGGGPTTKKSTDILVFPGALIFLLV